MKNTNVSLRSSLQTIFRVPFAIWPAAITTNHFKVSVTFTESDFSSENNDK